MLTISMGFFILTAYYTVAVKTKRIKIESITPTLYAIDILTYQAKARISNSQEKHNIAKKLYYNGLYDNLYFYAGFDMMKQLADNGHGPSMMFQANVLSNRPSLDTENKAVRYYAGAAKQSQPHARERLEQILKTTKYKLAQH